MDEEEKPSIWKQVYVILLSLILLGLLLSYLLFAPVDHILRGKLSSQSVRDNTLRFDDMSIIFLNNTDQFLSTLYESEQTLRAVETSACLFGTVNGDRYSISEVYQPEIIQQSYNHVQFTACPPETIVMLHTHPYLHCEASQTDLDTLERRQRVNKNVKMIIMCAPNDYVIYN